MPDVPASLVALKNAMHQTGPWVILFEIDLDGTHALRIAGADAPVPFDGKTWSAFPVKLEGLVDDGDGALSPPTATVSNLSGELATKLEAGELLDRTVHIYRASTEDPDFAFDLGVYRIAGATLDATVATFELGLEGLFDVPLPGRRQNRTRCDYDYGGPECGYQTALPNLIAATRPDFDPARCDFSEEGGNGCAAHGENEAANGRPNRHPERCGTLSGIPKGPAQL